jgi:hypothetical protein
MANPCAFSRLGLRGHDAAIGLWCCRPRALCKLLVKIYPLQTMKRKIDHAGQRRAATGVNQRTKQKQLSDL